MKKDNRLGDLVNGANPKCELCGKYLHSDVRGIPGFELMFVYACRNCGAAWRKKDGEE
jgi:tRNA(Ile2) C34 agmatinyltransferase TiaS